MTSRVRRVEEEANAGLTFPSTSAYRSGVASPLRSPVCPPARGTGRANGPGPRPGAACLFLLAVLLASVGPGAVWGNPPSSIEPLRLVEAARRQVGVTVGYDPAYRVLAYPGGDVAEATGVCTDVVTRALRAQGLDLQQAVHEDMKDNFARYPQFWKLKAPDANIDHRRVPNLQCFFTRRGWSRPVSAEPADYLPGDVVAWSLGGGLTHVGIVSDARTATVPARPLILHNIGAGTREEDLLFTYRLIGHYRFPPRRD